MKCPKCNKQSISFGTFISKFNPFSIKCKNCGTDLKSGKLLTRLFWFFYIYSCITGFYIGWTGNRHHWEATKILLVFGAIFLAAAIPVTYIGWHYGQYVIKEK
jgi:hypothetical protein